MVKVYGCSDTSASTYSSDLLSRIADLLEIADYLKANYPHLVPERLNKEIWNLFNENIRADWNYSIWKYEKMESE